VSDITLRVFITAHSTTGMAHFKMSETCENSYDTKLCGSAADI